jgi:hypothetical protein
VCFLKREKNNKTLTALFKKESMSFSSKKCTSEIIKKRRIVFSKKQKRKKSLLFTLNKAAQEPSGDQN